MKTSNNGRQFIEQYEGLRLKAYKDATGTLTIGYGHTSAAGVPKVTAGMTITQDQADQMLSKDLTGFEQDITNLVKVPLNQNQFDALVSFQYNTGALGRSSILKALNKGDYQGAAGKLTLYDVSKGKVLPGLTKRRAAEKAMFLRPVTATAAHTTAGGVVVAGGTALTQTPHIYWPYIIAGTVLAVIVSYILYKWFNRGK